MSLPSVTASPLGSRPALSVLWGERVRFITIVYLFEYDSIDKYYNDQFSVVM
eukprot:COSAG02_NODE_65_length_42645_cov_26.951934_39_plen_52_part_00